MAFLENGPINEGHVLLIPKKHYLDIDMQNGGAFNDIGHYHMHIFPRYEKDGFGWRYSEEVYEHSEIVAEPLRKVLYN